MNAGRIVLVTTIIWLCVLEPFARDRWANPSATMSRAVDIVALPFRLAWLAAQQPDTALRMPVEGAKVHRVTDSWGAPRPGGRVHRGQDIFAPKGSTVFSAIPGYVVRVGHNRLGGNVVIITGAGGRRYYYAHLDAFAPGVRVGKKVTPQTPIGFVGNTGNAAQTPPHLHFAVYTRSGAINPLPLLRDRPPSFP